MKKSTLIITMFMFISFASAGLGTFQQDTCVDIRTILNTTQVNISSIGYPNNTIAYLNLPMTKNANTFNYTFCDTNPIGDYVYDYNDLEGNVFVNDFTITYTGENLDNSESIIYFALLGVMTLLLLISIWFTNKLPDKNMKDEGGRIIQVSDLKHLRRVMWGVVYLIIWGIIFVSANLSIAYLPSGMIGNLLFNISIGMGYLLIPLLLLMFWKIIENMLHDREIKKLMERGIDIE